MLRSNSGTDCSGAPLVTNATSIGEPTTRRSRPLRHIAWPIAVNSTTSRATATLTVVGVAENARTKDHRSLRIGWGSGTAPLGRPTTTVIPSYGWRFDWAKVAVDPFAWACSHPRVDPVSPWKHAVPVRSAGADTCTVARSMGTSHEFPMAFQYSSSCSGKPLRAPRTSYV